MSAKKGLGRGFESLIPSDLLDESFDPTAGDDHKVSELRHIKLTEISPDPDQPRRYFDEASLAELTESIKVHGVLQPIVVTTHAGKYQIVAGERRYRASSLAGLKTIPALVRSLSGQHKLELALIENIQRRDLNPIETATAYAKLRDQFNLSLEEIGVNVGGKSVSAVSNTLRLLRLPKAVQQAIVEHKITEGQARPLIDFDEKRSLELLPRILAEGWSARKIEQVIREQKQSGSKRAETPATVAYETVQQRLEKRYKTGVRVVPKGKHGGRITIDFKSEAELDRLMSDLL